MQNQELRGKIKYQRLTVYLVLFLLVISGGFFIKSNIYKIKYPSNTDWTVAKKQIQVAASFYPLAEFVKKIGGENIKVINITPSWVEPHDYEPTPQDLVNLQNSKLVLFNGNGLDVWGEKIQNDLQTKGVKIFKVSDYLDSLKNNIPDEDGGGLDPHFWLDPKNVEKIVDLVAETLIEVDPVNKNQYTQNKEYFKKQLADLNEKYVSGLKSCSQNTIVTSHNAFNYMAARYNFNTLYILGFSPEEEPSPRTIAEVAKKAKQKGIKHIFFERLVSPKLSETIANEIGARTLVLNPIEGLTDEEIAKGKSYISVMQENLENLKIALQCQ